MKKGCGVLFKSESGIIVCGENRVDGNCFLCEHCLKNESYKTTIAKIIQLEEEVVYWKKAHLDLQNRVFKLELTYNINE